MFSLALANEMVVLPNEIEDDWRQGRSNLVAAVDY